MPDVSVISTETPGAREGESYAKFDFLVAGPPVAAITCMTCGATMLLNAAFDVMRTHDDWHARVFTQEER